MNSPFLSDPIRVLRLVVAAGLLAGFAFTEDTVAVGSTATTPVVFTTRQDHQDMLDQLGITRLRPGRNADSNASMPDVHVDLLDGALAWRQHDGGHTDEPNVEPFIRWAQAQWAHNDRPDERLKREHGESMSQEAAARSLETQIHVAVERRDENSRMAHLQLLEKARQGRIDIYFQGDSITRRWGATDYPHLLAHWQKHFHGWNAANFAWGGDTTHNILWRIQNGGLDGVSPKVVVLQAGANNLPWGGPADEVKVDEVIQGIQAILTEFQQRLPDATIVLTAMFPRSQNLDLAPAITRINERIETLADGERIRFLNLNQQLANSTGRLLPGMSYDGLHLDEPAYEIWAQGLKPIFHEILGPPDREDYDSPSTGAGVVAPAD